MPTTDMTHEEQVIDILEKTKDLFVETHWTTGTLYQVGEDGKKRFCAVGGFCNTLVDLTGIDNLPDFQPGEVDYFAMSWFDADTVGPEVAEERHQTLLLVIRAERELAYTVSPEQWKWEERDGGRGAAWESLIIGWNDNEAENSEAVVAAFDSTIARIRNEGLIPERVTA